MSARNCQASTELLRKWTVARSPDGEGVANPPTSRVRRVVSEAWQRKLAIACVLFIGDQWRQIKDLLSSGATGRCQKEIP